MPEVTRPTVNLELLLGRRVLGRDGRSIGRIEEIRVEPQGEDLVLIEYHVGADAVLERLSASSIGGTILDVLHLRDRRAGHRVPWDKLDLTDPSRPQLLCDLSELAPLEHYG